MNYVIALIPALCFGILSPLVAYFGGGVRQQIVGQMAGGLLIALIASIFIHPHFTPKMALISFLTGIMCALGIALQVACFKIIGVSRTMPISSGLQLTLTALAGVLIFHEWDTAGSLGFGIAAIVTIILGISLTTYTERSHKEPTVISGHPNPHGKKTSTVSSAAMRKGLLINLVSALLLSGYVVIIRGTGQTFQEFMLPQAFGYFAGAFLFAAVRGDHAAPLVSKVTAKQMIPGLLFGIGVVSMQSANRLVGVATGFTLSQMGVIINTLAGIYILHEHKTKKELTASLGGVALVAVGAVLIGVAKSLSGQ